MCLMPWWILVSKVWYDHHDSCSETLVVENNNEDGQKRYHSKSRSNFLKKDERSPKLAK